MYNSLDCMQKHPGNVQVSNETTVHVRRPGNPKKWRAKVLCEGKIADLALVTVEDDQFWTNELLDLQFVDVPELQVSSCLHVCIESVHALLVPWLCLGGDSTGNCADRHYHSSATV